MIILLKFKTNSDSKSNRIKDKINEFKQFTGFDYDNIFTEILPTVIGWNISIPSNVRELASGKNERDTSKYLSNVFLRPIFDMSRENDENSFYLKGTVQIATNRGYNNSVFLVDDFILTKNISTQNFEHKIYCETDYTSLFKENFNDYNSNENILSTDLLEQVPLITSPSKINNFTQKWDNYLEFERGIFTRNMRAVPINKWEIISLSELSRTAENEDLFKNDIKHKTEQSLFVTSESNKLQGDEEIYTLIKLSVSAKELEANELKNFARNRLSIINNKGVEFLNKLKEQEKLEESDRIKSINLGDLLYSGKGSDYHTIVKFIIDEEDSDKLNKKIEKFGNELFLADIASGDIALYKRGKEALDKIQSGNVKHPLLVSYLLEPEKNDSLSNIENDIDFVLKHLNDTQKEAIVKCLNSESIFLIQGPPGTGKTQVITELVYQYIKRGERVLMSSQTHIAIDNVLERLPNELDILPIRLVNENRKSRQDFLPDKLVDVLYENIEKKYTSNIKEFENYSSEIVETENKYKNILALQKKIKRKRSDIEKYEKEREELVNKKFKENDKLNDIEVHLKEANNTLNLFERFINSNYQIDAHYDKINYEPLYQKLSVFINKMGFDSDKYKNLNDLLYFINKISGQKKIDEVKSIISNTSKIPQELREIEKEISEKEEAIKVMKSSKVPQESISIIIKEINNLLKKKKDIEQKTGKKLSTKNIEWYFSDSNNDIYVRAKKELDKINNFNEDLINLFKALFTSDERDKLINKKEELQKQYDTIFDKLKKIDVKINQIERQKQDIENPIKSDNKKIEEYFNEFFADKEKLNDNSIPETDEAKLKKIKNHIDKEKKKLQEKRDQFSKVEGIYKSVLNHLKNKDEFIRKDREKFTKDLFTNNANIFGITCTSSPYFSENRNSYLKELGLGDISLRDKDFDVVIIDEVSKATPIEILIPILYGKKVVLVGDHRQLPPIFKYRESNFGGMSDIEKNDILRGHPLDYYKKMVEDSLFEEIFSKLENNKAILTQQYRFHEQIMNCVNVFYDDQLKMGLGKEQNNKKQHNLEITLNKNGKEIPVIIKSSHTYWFDSGKDINNNNFFEKINEGETSLYNPLEAQLTFELIKRIDKAYGKLKKEDIEAYKRSIGNEDNDRPSVGIISMYGKHVGEIKKLIKKEKFHPQNIILINSTIDDYQGKENDIIILNFVRNNTQKRAGEFIRKFNRINVAISRARNLLIIIGAKDFTNSLNVEVPDILTNKIKKIKAYQEIYNQCDKKLNYAATRFEIKITE